MFGMRFPGGSEIKIAIMVKFWPFLMITFLNLLFLTSLLSSSLLSSQSFIGKQFSYPSFCLWNPGSWYLESVIQVKESGIPLTIGIENLSFIRKESEIPYLESGVQRVWSRILNCLGLPHWSWQWGEFSNRTHWGRYLTVLHHTSRG